MTLKKLIAVLLKIQSDKDAGNEDVEVFIPEHGMTFIIDKVSYVQKYDFENTSKGSPSILLQASE